ncbi:MAG: sulfatase [Pirellulaceae bacterium]
MMILAWACCGWLFAPSSESLLAESRPNVVLIVSDDQSYRDFGFMGNDRVQTPHLDRLASQSARYSNGYVSMSVCRPSLATLLTGLYPHQHGIHFNHPPPGLKTMRSLAADQYHQTRATTDYLVRNTATLPRILSRHGYACLQTGKHWEGDYRTAGFTHGMTRGQPAKQLGPVTGTRTQENGQWVAHGNGDAGLVIGRETMQPIYDFVKEHAGRQPFFVWYAPFLPHVPYDAPERFKRIYDGKQVPVYLLPYYAEIARFDETVGQLLQYLQRQSLLKNTLIVFVTDNGLRPDPDRPDRQDRRSKLSPYEDGLRTPILVRWDGHTRPGEHRQLVQAIDLVPTILTAAGLAGEITPRMKGLDLMGSAAGREPLPERPAFGAIFANDASVLGKPSRHVRGRWIRQGRFKMIVPGPAARPLPRSLFDLVKDPQERINLAQDPTHVQRMKNMIKLLDGWWSARDDFDVTKPVSSRSP